MDDQTRKSKQIPAIKAGKSILDDCQLDIPIKLLVDDRSTAGKTSALRKSLIVQTSLRRPAVTVENVFRLVESIVIFCTKTYLTTTILSNRQACNAYTPASGALRSPEDGILCSLQASLCAHHATSVSWPFKCSEISEHKLGLLSYSAWPKHLLALPFGRLCFRVPSPSDQQQHVPAGYLVREDIEQNDGLVCQW